MPARKRQPRAVGPQFSIGLALSMYSVLLGVLPIVIVVGIAINLFEHHVQQQSVNQMTALAEAKTQDIRRWLGNSQTYIDLMLTNPDQYRRMQDILLARGPVGPRGVIISRFLEDQLALQQNFEELFLYNLEGEIRLSTDAQQVGKNVETQPYFQNSLQQSYVQPPYFDAERGALTCIILQSIRHQSGYGIGVLAGRLNLTTLSSIMTTRLGLGETGETYLINRREQNFVTLSRFVPYDSESTYHSYGIDTVLKGINGAAFYRNYRGQEVIGIHRWIPELESGMLAEIETAEAFAPLVNIRQISLVLAGLMALLALGIGLLINMRIAVPLHHLTQVALAVMEGDYKQRAQIKSRTEIGQLARAFDAMTNQLEQLIGNLERQVAERTAQLDEAMKAEQHARLAAEEANDLKTKFIANMSHELRTPLNSIINFTYIIRSGLRGPVTDRQVEYLDRVQASGEHLLGLINDILDLAKIEAGRMELCVEPFQLGDLVASATATAIGLTKEKPIELHCEISEGLPHITADKTRIRQVLLNLLSNAAKFTDQGHITVRVWQEGYALITSVSDTGIGIPADKFATIFEEFRQADEGSTRSYQGTGLGLPICQRLIAMHGGRIWVESAVGVGSTFYFSLPLAVPPVVDTLLSLPLAGTAQGTVVLVIDDDPAAIDIVRTYLSQDGYSVYGSTDGRAALDEARQLRPAAILLDILLPHQDGWELLGAFKASPDLQPIPIICYTVVDDIHRGLALGASAYLLKPIQEGALRQTVRQVVGMQAHILVIDDDPDVRELVPHYLSQYGYVVTTAANGREGLDQIAAQRPDLVLLDLMMPILDGFAVLDTLDAQAETRSIPVVVLTAKDMTPDEQHYLTERVQGLLAKAGSTLTDVLAQVRTVFRQHQSAAPLSDTRSHQ